MLNIAICDDNKILCSELEEIICEVSKQYRIQFNIEVFYSGEKLYETIQKELVDIIFLDIELNSISGIEIAESIRNSLQNYRMQIIFISANQNYAIQLFRTRPMDFLVKPFNYEDIDRVLNDAQKIINRENQIFEFHQGKATIRLPYRDIMYFESSNRIVKTVTFKEILPFYSTLNDVNLNINNYEFILIHKSYLINYQYIKKIEYEQITMLNEKKLPISQSRRKTVRAIFLEIEKKRGL